MKQNIVFQKSKEFALDVINIYKKLYFDDKERVMSVQLLRSATSIGANIAESVCASSSADFLNKIYISLKESKETGYWIELLFMSHYISEDVFKKLTMQCDEITKILMATTKKLKIDN